MFQKYKKDDPQYIFSFIKKHPFATFVMNGDNLLATHIPVLVEGEPGNFRLYAHIAEKNEQYPYLKDGAEALIIFHGPQSYVSSSWYEDVDISTWDYSAVHVNVKIKIQSREELKNSLKNLIQEFEQEQEKPLYYEQIPQQMIEDHLPYITGFWGEPFKVQAIAKLHQGYGKKDVDSVVKHLKTRANKDADALSEEIRKEHDQ